MYLVKFLSIYFLFLHLLIEIFNCIVHTENVIISLLVLKIFLYDDKKSNLFDNLDSLNMPCGVLLTNDYIYIYIYIYIYTLFV